MPRPSADDLEAQVQEELLLDRALMDEKFRRAQGCADRVAEDAANQHETRAEMMDALNQRWHAIHDRKHPRPDRLRRRKTIHVADKPGPTVTWSLIGVLAVIAIALLFGTWP